MLTILKRSMTKMTKKQIRILKYLLALSLIVLLVKIFVPRHYAIPRLQQRKSTQFMNLATGSRIGYTLLAGKGIKKPFPIIYLHGGPGGVVSDSIISTLSNFMEDGYDVFVYDQIGSGESDRLTDINEYTVDRHIEDLQAIIKHLGVKKVILLGQSWGSVLATYYASEHSADIEKIILCNPGPLYPYPKGLDAIKPPDSLNLKSPIFTNAEGNAKVKNVRISVVAYCAIHFGIKLADDNEADEFSTYASYEVNKSTVFDTSKIVKITGIKAISSKNGYYSGIMTFEDVLKQQDRRPQLKTLMLPILVVKSQYDNQKWGFTNDYLETFKNHKLVVIPKAGHNITREQPALFLENIRHFLKE